MDESAQQAVQLGVNLIIFVIALSISLTLLLGVRNVAEMALEYDASLPTGSVIVAIEDIEKRTITGDELLSYYTRYMSEQAQLVTSGKYIFAIENKDGTKSITKNTNFNGDLKSFFSSKGIDLSSEYEVIVTEYRSEDEVLKVLFKEV